MTSMPTNSSSIEIRELIICKRYYFSASVDLKDYHQIDPPIHGDSISHLDHSLLMVASQHLDNSNPETNSMTSQDDDCLACKRNLDPQWYLSRSIYPLSYSIPDELIVSGVPAKEHLWAEIIPGESLTYRFDHSQEEEYRAMYQSSMFGFTRKKGGWDALRHYELLANAVLPVFQALRDCPPSSLTSFPKSLVEAAVQELLPWNSSAASQLRYVHYVEELLSHTRKHCSTSAAAQYFLSRVQSQGRMGSVSIRNILLLTGHSEVNYSRETLWIGLKRYISSIGRCADFL
jgi:hypothetical protein